MPQRNKVFRQFDPLPKHRVSALLAAGWARIALKHGKGNLADAIETSEKTVENAMSGKTLPEFHTALNSLSLDPTALDEVLAGFGFRIIPLHSDAANDINTAAGVIHAMGELVRAQEDGHRDHNETLAIAQLLRPYMPAMQAIIVQADQIRGAA